MIVFARVATAYPVDATKRAKITDRVGTLAKRMLPDFGDDDTIVVEINAESIARVSGGVDRVVTFYVPDEVRVHPTLSGLNRRGTVAIAVRGHYYTAAARRTCPQ
ncbi:MAG TPA: hypothetical protein VHQ86_02100 [Candidatus Saccharimonadia bacterium]|jgi:hypothetical protein|nr:hypothetical protein [Candidatus Saccharimonadia bacterium]